MFGKFGFERALHIICDGVITAFAFIGVGTEAASSSSTAVMKRKRHIHQLHRTISFFPRSETGFLAGVIFGK